MRTLEEGSCGYCTCLHRWDCQHGVHGVDHGKYSRWQKDHTVATRELASAVVVGSWASRVRFGVVVGQQADVAMWGWKEGEEWCCSGSAESQVHHGKHWYRRQWKAAADVCRLQQRHDSRRQPHRRRLLWWGLGHQRVGRGWKDRPGDSPSSLPQAWSWNRPNLDEALLRRRACWEVCFPG